MSRVSFSVAMTSDVNHDLLGHLLQHLTSGQYQEDLCFALWRPSTGATRQTALIREIVFPCPGDRSLHGNASFAPHYFERVLATALKAEAGIAFLHSHPGPDWQDMSGPDITAEERLTPRVFGATGLPLVGLTVGTDGTWSARFWLRSGTNQVRREWCGSVRVVGEDYRVSYHPRLAPKPVFRKELARTYSAWGEEKQALIARQRLGIVGAGSVGALVARGGGQAGVEDIDLIDFDTIEHHNLDRDLDATAADVGRPKVDLRAEKLRLHATADPFDVLPHVLSVTSESGFRAALDCDALLCCVDRPWPRQVVNMIAHAHLIPVIDGGVAVGVTKSGDLRGADWRAHTTFPGRPCLECLKQYDPADVGLERSGLLDDPTYIAQLPKDHFIHRNENVFAFCMNAAGLMQLQFLSLMVQPGGISNPGAQIFHFVTGSLDKSEMDGVGFEPTRRVHRLPVFKTGAFNHSAIDKSPPEQVRHCSLTASRTKDQEKYPL